VKLQYSAEVSRARRMLRPLVALESSVLAQGLPYPHNVEAARRCEAAVREEGAVPATVAVIDGELWVGLDAEKIERLATGGLGGVHRGVETHLDISQDLPAIAKHPVAVVCAGVKSVLDLPRTMELLETLAVPVIGVGTDELPGFYTRETGIRLEHSVADAAEASAVVRARGELEQGGVIFAVPPPKATALERAVVEKHLAAALAAAKKKKIAGKAVTPFLLGEMARRTKGKALEANLALLENNARFAAKLAVAMGWR